MLRKILFTFTAILMLSGCKSTLMTTAQNQTLTNVTESQSQIVFMRSAFVGQAIQASVFDVTSGSPEFIGIVSNDTKVVYETEPGERMFMVVGESADFLQANLSGGKTYYTVVSPRMGFWKARFSMHPVRNSGAANAKFEYGTDEFRKIDKNTQIVVAGEKALGWATSNSNDIIQKLNEYLPEWKGKATEKQMQATINPEDHI